MKQSFSFEEEFTPEDYSYAVTKEWVSGDKIPHSKKAINGSKEFEVVYKIILFEFEKTVIINSLENIEQQAVDLIKKEMESVKELPRPSKASLSYTGRLTLRIDSDLHKALHIKSLLTGESINGLIEKTLRLKTIED